MKHTISLSVCLAILSLPVQAADLYRWVDSRGVVHYSDMPSPEAEKIDSRKFSDQVAPGEELPYGTRIAKQNFPVTLYTGNGCGDACDRARSTLTKRGIPYAEKMLRTKDEIDAFKQLTGSEIVPTLAVGTTVLKGFQSEQWHGELDIAGYPKTATYRQRIAPPPPAPSTPPAPQSPTADGQATPAEPAAP